MKRIMILSAGTGTAWSIVQAIRNLRLDDIQLMACDINPPYLVHTSVYVDRFFQVPPIQNPDYYEVMLSLFKKEKIDILIPLIDWDLFLFSHDNSDLRRLNICSTAPERNTFEMLSDKTKLFENLTALGIRTPNLFSADTVKSGEKYYIKPKIGFGSRNAKVIMGEAILDSNLQDFIIQELCSTPEITVDAFFDGTGISCICRERIEIKSGVCTKAKIFKDDDILKKLHLLSTHFKLPNANCVQFMKTRDGEWALTDFNLRLGAGSSLSAAVGFKMARSAVALWLGLPEAVSIVVPEQEHYVCRYYEEVVTK